MFSVIKIFTLLLFLFEISNNTYFNSVVPCASSKISPLFHIRTIFICSMFSLWVFHFFSNFQNIIKSILINIFPFSKVEFLTQSPLWFSNMYSDMLILVSTCIYIHPRGKVGINYHIVTSSFTSFHNGWARPKRLAQSVQNPRALISSIWQLFLECCHKHCQNEVWIIRIVSFSVVAEHWVNSISSADMRDTFVQLCLHSKKEEIIFFLPVITIHLRFHSATQTCPKYIRSSHHI